MKRFYWLALALVPALALSQAQGPFGIFGGPIPSANLAPATQVPANTYAFTSDIGLVMDNGTEWVAAGGSGGSPAFSAITSGTNTAGAFVMGSGSSLTSSGGTIAATTAAAAATTPATCGAGVAATGVDANFNPVGCFTPTGSGTVNSASGGLVACYTVTGTAVSGCNVTGTGNFMQATGPIFTLPGYATASLPTCNSSSKGELAYTTDGTPAEAFCNGTSWVSTGGTTFTVAGTGCTPTGATGGATAGKFTLGAGPCTAVTITFNGAVGMPATNGWHCTVNDQTALNAGTWIPVWGQKSSTTTTAVLPIPASAGTTDVITFACTGY